jgi:hypothetical protein
MIKAVIEVRGGVAIDGLLDAPAGQLCSNTNSRSFDQILDY